MIFLLIVVIIMLACVLIMVSLNKNQAKQSSGEQKNLVMDEGLAGEVTAVESLINSLRDKINVSLAELKEHQAQICKKEQDIRLFIENKEHDLKLLIEEADKRLELLSACPDVEKEVAEVSDICLPEEFKDIAELSRQGLCNADIAKAVGRGIGEIELIKGLHNS